MTIRPYEPIDRDAVVALWRATGLARPVNDPYRDIDRKLSVDPKGFLVAVVDGEVVGTAMAGYDGHRGWINYLGVAPDRQREGIGRKLVEAAVEMLRGRECPKVNLQVLRTNHAAVGFYEAVGFKEDPVLSMGLRLVRDEPIVQGMAKPAALDRLTFEEFLLLEEVSPVKHDFIDGCMVERFAEAMAGGSRNHILITPALGRMLGNALRGRKCRSFDADAMVRVGESGTGYYPDGAIACPPNFVSERVGVIDNPTVLFEVPSPSTEKHDRGEKFHNYRLLPSLQDYVLVATDRKMVEVFSRQDDGSWNLRIFIQGSTAHLPSVGIDLPLDELYEDAVFDEA